MKINFKKNNGLTLLEVLVAMGIFSLIMLAVTSFQKDVITNNKYAYDYLSGAQDARSILRTMVKELRVASPSNNGAYALVQAATSSITFFSDTDGDGLREQIRYFIVSNILKKGSIKPTGNPTNYIAGNEIFTILAYNIKNATSSALFEYYDDNYAGTSSPLAQPVTTTDVRLVKINLMIDADPNRSPVPYLYTSQVSFRNLKDNL